VVPFFFNSKGGVGRPSRWSSGKQEDSWRGGFLLAALEMYLKNDMRAKFVFLKDVEAAVGFTSTMMTQDFMGSTTIVPQVRFKDYFSLMSDPPEVELHHYVKGGAIAAYEHIKMIQKHYSISNAIEECVAKLESSKRQASNAQRRSNGADRGSTNGHTSVSPGSSISDDETAADEEEYESLWHS
jgi:hypothetical protein